MTQATHTSEPVKNNGTAWAALLAAALGGFAFGILTDASECSARVAKWLIWYPPSGALSGVAISAILLWLISWAALHYSWRGSRITAEKSLTAIIVLLALAAILATFPPFYEILGH